MRKPVAKARILFVDDEQRVLDGIRRMLRGQRHIWEMSFAGSGADALKMLGDEGFDVIVSDMRMPGMSGSELLGAIREQYPGTVRIALTGHASPDTVLECVGTVHQYLPKPTDVQVLQQTIGSVCTQRDLIDNERLRTLITRLDELPCMPTTHARLLEEAAAPRASLAALSELISQDFALSAKVMQLANSAFFGAPTKPILGPGDAVAHLGSASIRSLVTDGRIGAPLEESQPIALPPHGMWEHALAVKGAAASIARAEAVPETVARESSLAGMLHDIGKLVLAVHLPQEYQAALRRASVTEIPEGRAERELLGASHAEIGAYLLALWGFATSVVRPIAHHHDPLPGLDATPQALTFVHAADALVHETMSPTAGQAGSPGVPSRLDLDYIEQVGLTEQIAAWRPICARDAPLEEAG